ncbi:hypothetical protein NLX83_22345 [Allokutzneria sp. A3M-2-11 16]|uniref:hypothetical protein n=1 Tax=Allokutzneria sp. A3M-2-11 16 TaxID=2962043 RepID=UPI0020B79B92|nr:hypothetical protein [Allokutzneria sp. A3M-2-11 16]MCP3802010.1 hypothetical protein [Allokutzneria sp. A3M-2-11 16]
MTDQRTRRSAEQWFRRRGLPSVVRGRPTRLVVRIVPAVVLVALWNLLTDLLVWLAEQGGDELGRFYEDSGYALAYGSLLLGLAALPVLGAWLAARWIRRHIVEAYTARGSAPAVTIVVAFVVLCPVFSRIVSPTSSVVMNMIVNLSTVLVLVGAAFVGAGSILGWSLRAAFRQVRLLGTLASRALPLLLLITIFGFFTAEVWQLNAALPRHQLWLMAGLFAALALLFMTAMNSDELRELAASQPTQTEAEKLRASPFRSLVEDGVVAPPIRHVPLRWIERANMVLVLMLAQAFQALIFAILTFCFFVALGLVAVRPEVMKAWSEADPVGGTLFGFQIPVPDVLLQVSIFLAAFSGLNFVASTSSDARYRQSFLNPFLDHMRVSLSARQLYLEHWRTTTTGQSSGR